jgi:hypothetical protein
MRVPDQVRDCVAFVGSMSITPTGHQHMWSGGTAFFVSVPSQISQGKIAHVYLVTAKHVAIHLLEQDFTISLNNKEGTEGVHINVPAEHAQWSAGLRRTRRLTPRSFRQVPSSRMR